MTAPLSIALLGAGIFARDAHCPALAALASAGSIRIAAIWSRSSASTSALSALYTESGVSPEPRELHGDDGLDTVMNDQSIAAVILAVPISSLGPLSLRALRAGKHVLSEKPLASSGPEAAQLLLDARTAVAAAAAAGSDPLMYCVAENFRCERAVVAAGELVTSGALGTLIGAELVAHVVMKEGSKYAKGWRMVSDVTQSHIAGQILDGGVHYVAGLRVVCGSDIKRVSALARKHTAHLPDIDSVHACT
jgi:predicted dehydrogenase